MHQDPTEVRLLRALREIVNDCDNESDYEMGRAFAAILWHLQHTDGELSLWLSEMPRPRDT